MRCKTFAFLFLILIISVPLLAQKQLSGEQQAPQLNMTYGELSVKWFQWAFSMPWDHHPLFDHGDCANGQSGPVWFLGGQFCETGGSCSYGPVSRTCTVPKGKALFFPIINNDYSFLENPVGWTETDLRTHPKADLDPAINVIATLDGRSVPIVRICTMGNMCDVTQSPLSPFTLAGEKNMLAAIPEYTHNNPAEGLIADGAFSMMVTDGYYVLLQNVPPGQHTIHFHGELPQFGFGLDVTYHITIMQ